jgi:hypothetical protein
MPEDDVIGRAREDEREGKSPSTQAGEFVREEIEHVREGKHGARSTKQAIAIGLSTVRRAGVKLPPRKASSGGRSSTSSGRGRSPKRRPPSSKSSRTRAIASLNAVRRERRDSLSRAICPNRLTVRRESVVHRSASNRQRRPFEPKENWAHSVAQSEARVADSWPCQLFPVERLPQVSPRVTTSLRPV